MPRSVLGPKDRGRRAFVQAALAMATGVGAESRPARVIVAIADEWKSSTIEALKTDSAVFERAYTACPQHRACVGAILSGHFPHTATSADALLPALLRDAGIPCDVMDRAANPPRDANMLLIATATNGGMPRTHHGASADSWYEESVRVPLLVRWPARIRPISIDVLASSVDIAP